MGVNGNWGSCCVPRSVSSGYQSSGPESRGNLRERYGFYVSVGQGSNNKVVQGKVMPTEELHSTFSTCVFGDNAFKQLVYDSSYRSQVLHHYILFELVSEDKVTFITLCCDAKSFLF